MAKRFKFRLAALLDLRKRREEEQRRVVARRVREIQRSRGALSELHRRVDDAMAQARRDCDRPAIDVASVLQGQRWRAHLKRRIGEQCAEIDGLASLLRDERMGLARRATERKAIEKLRERRLAEYHAARRRRERFEEDEIASNLCERRGNSGRPALVGG